MKAIVKYEEGYGKMELRDVPEPNPSDKEVKIKVKAVGICGTDLLIYKWNICILTKVPFIVGHEFAGIVTDIGKNVMGIKTGDRITAENSRYVCNNHLF